MNPSKMQAPVQETYNLRARWYNPEIGRFMTMDTHPGSIFDPRTLHKYLYCGNDPVNNTDPSGEYFLISITIGTSISGMLRSYALTNLKILFDAIYMAQTMLKPALEIQNYCYNAILSGYADSNIDSLFRSAKELECEAYRFLAQSIVNNYKTFAKGLIFTVKFKLVLNPETEQALDLKKLEKYMNLLIGAVNGNEKDKAELYKNTVCDTVNTLLSKM